MHFQFSFCVSWLLFSGCCSAPRFDELHYCATIWLRFLFNDSKLTFSNWLWDDFVKYDLDEFINYDFEYARDFEPATTDSQPQCTSVFYGVSLLFSNLKWRQSHEFTRTVNYRWFWNMQFACAYFSTSSLHIALFSDCCKQ